MITMSPDGSWKGNGSRCLQLLGSVTMQARDTSTTPPSKGFTASWMLAWSAPSLLLGRTLRGPLRPCLLGPPRAAYDPESDPGMADPALPLMFSHRHSSHAGTRAPPRPYAPPRGGLGGAALLVSIWRPHLHGQDIGRHQGVALACR